MNQLVELVQNKVKQVLSEIFHTKEIENLQPHGNHTVNHLFSFQVEEKKFMLKILTRNPAEEAEFYRLEKEVYLLKLFKKKTEAKGVSQQNKIFVPVPEIIHLETNVERLGYKFYIMSYVPGNTLEEIWEQLNIQQKEIMTKSLAKILKDIHSITFEMFGNIEDFDCPRRFYSFTSMIKSNIRRSTRKLGPTNLVPIELLTDSLKFVEENLEKLDNDKTARLVHTDFYPTNIIVDKNETNEWIVVAILDFEWSYAGNVIHDLINVKEELITEKKFQDIFFEEYFGEKKDLSDYKLLERIFQIVGELYSIAYGWTNFHPTKENLDYAKKRIREALEK